MLKIKITKREEIAISSIVLTIFMLFLFLVPLGAFKFIFVILFVFFTFGVSLFVGREGLKNVEYLLLPILPVLFSVSTALFYGIIPERWLTRLFFIFTYGFLIYSIFLILNIFNAAKLKNIQLLKVARTIYFFISAFTVFLFSYVLMSFHIVGFLTSLFLSVFIFLISIAFIWSFFLKKAVEATNIMIAIFTAILMFEVSFAISFWPLNIYLAALFFTSIYYSLMGIIDNLLNFRVRGWSYLEYLVLNGIIFLLCVLSLNFG